MFKPVKHFQKYSPEQRADRAASHRMHHRQKQAVGEFFWTHQAVPGIAFPTRKAAIKAAWAECNRIFNLPFDQRQQIGMTNFAIAQEKKAA